MIIGIVLAIAATVLISRQPGENIRSRRDRAFQTAEPKSAVTKKTPTNSPAAFRTSSALPLAVESISQPPLRIETPPASVKQPQTPPIEPATRYHIIQNGETLSSIAVNYYGSRKHIDKIKAANPLTLKNPDRIRPGTRIIIPQ